MGNVRYTLLCAFSKRLDQSIHNRLSPSLVFIVTVNLIVADYFRERLRKVLGGVLRGSAAVDVRDRESGQRIHGVPTFEHRPLHHFPQVGL